MGLFNKLKEVLFEEEEIEDEVVTSAPAEVRNEIREEVREYRPIPEVEVPQKPKEPTFEKIETNDFSERELFKSDSTFKFPAFDEEEFKESMPQKPKEEKKEVNNSFDYERKNRLERRNEYSRLDSLRVEEKPKEEKKRFKPSPTISPVYGILDKDYKVEDITEAPKNNGTILTNKDLDVDSVRAKAYGKLEDKLENAKRPVIKNETYDIKKETTTEVKKAPAKKEEKIDDVVISEEPIIKDSHKLMEERTKTIDELLKDASDEVIDASDAIIDDIDNEINIDDEYSKFEEEIDEEINNDDSNDDLFIKDDEISNKNALEDDTLENDLYDLIDSMYDNTEEGE